MALLLASLLFSLPPAAAKAPLEQRFALPTPCPSLQAKHYGDKCVPCDASKDCSGNGSCNRNGGDCDCKAGWEGADCSKNTDDCAEMNGAKPCKNGGTCVDMVNGYRCECKGTGQPLVTLRRAFAPSVASPLYTPHSRDVTAEVATL